MSFGGSVRRLLNELEHNQYVLVTAPSGYRLASAIFDKAAPHAWTHVSLLERGVPATIRQVRKYATEGVSLVVVGDLDALSSDDILDALTGLLNIKSQVELKSPPFGSTKLLVRSGLAFDALRDRALRGRPQKERLTLDYFYAGNRIGVPLAIESWGSTASTIPDTQLPESILRKLEGPPGLAHPGLARLALAELQRGVPQDIVASRLVELAMPLATRASRDLRVRQAAALDWTQKPAALSDIPTKPDAFAESDLPAPLREALMRWALVVPAGPGMLCPGAAALREAIDRVR